MHSKHLMASLRQYYLHQVIRVTPRGAVNLSISSPSSVLTYEIRIYSFPGLVKGGFGGR